MRWASVAPISSMCWRRRDCQRGPPSAHPALVLAAPNSGPGELAEIAGQRRNIPMPAALGTTVNAGKGNLLNDLPDGRNPPMQSASELLYFRGAPFAHIVAYEDYLRAQRLKQLPGRTSYSMPR